jgi:hypothetical protein
MLGQICARVRSATIVPLALSFGPPIFLVLASFACLSSGVDAVLLVVSETFTVYDTEENKPQQILRHASCEDIYSRWLLLTMTAMHTNQPMYI